MASTLTLGFTSEYYTLWSVSEPYKKYSGGGMVNGFYTGTVQLVVDCSYMQNLSKDYDKAVEKIKAMSGGNYKIDLDLRGTTTFVRPIGSPFEDENTPVYIFTFGKLAGEDIREATDVWQLNRAAKEERGKRRRAIARRRLIDLGQLVRNPFGGDNYITPAHLKHLSEKAEKANKSGHFFENGSRVTLILKRVGGTSWPVQFGYRRSTMFLEEYLTDAGQLVKYKGSSPLNINDEFVNVTGTIEHSEYNGMPETRLKRMKLVKA